MVTSPFPSAIVATLHLLPLLSFASAACTNITNVRISFDTSSDFTNEFGVPLETLICPSSNTTGCLFPRKKYDITIPRFLNISSSKALNPDADNPHNLPLFDLTSTQENEIFDLVGTNWALQQGSGGTNFTASDAGVLDTRFIARDRVIDNTVSQANGGPNDAQLKVKANSNGSMEFLPQYRRLTGILRACDGDMSAFEGVGIRAVAAYESSGLNPAPGVKGENITQVGGTLETSSGNLTGNSGSGSGSGTGTNTTKKGAGVRIGAGTSTAALAMSLVLAAAFVLL